MQLAQRLRELPDLDRQRVADLPLRGALREIAASASRPRSSRTTAPTGGTWSEELRAQIDRLADRKAALRKRAEELLGTVTLDSYSEVLREIKRLEPVALAIDAESAYIRAVLDFLSAHAELRLIELGAR